jgi:hypothetical protein
VADDRRWPDDFRSISLIGSLTRALKSMPCPVTGTIQICLKLARTYEARTNTELR